MCPKKNFETLLIGTTKLGTLKVFWHKWALAACLCLFDSFFSCFPGYIEDIIIKVYIIQVRLVYIWYSLCGEDETVILKSHSPVNWDFAWGKSIWNMDCVCVICFICDVKAYIEKKKCFFCVFSILFHLFRPRTSSHMPNTHQIYKNKTIKFVLVCWNSNTVSCTSPQDLFAHIITLNFYIKWIKLKYMLFFSRMVRKTNRGSWEESNMKLALEAVKTKEMSLREAAAAQKCFWLCRKKQDKA